jgi:hypothetical protein
MNYFPNTQCLYFIESENLSYEGHILVIAENMQGM